MTTTAKLRELLEAANTECPAAAWCGKCSNWRASVASCSANETLADAAPDLARLVVTLSEALRGYACGCPYICYVHMGDEEFDRMFQGWSSEGRITNVGALRKALADVEALEL